MDYIWTHNIMRSRAINRFYVSRDNGRCEGVDRSRPLRWNPRSWMSAMTPLRFVWNQIADR